MAEFVPVCHRSDVPDPGSIVVEVYGRMIALFHVDGQFWALDDRCTHDGGPLAEGPLEGHVVICPRHGARFDIRDGRALTMPATGTTVTHEVQVEGDEVRVRLRDD